jgi:SAM-dependent methyltransferase
MVLMRTNQEQRYEKVYGQYYRQLFQSQSALLAAELFKSLDPIESSLLDFYHYFEKNWGQEKVQNLSSERDTLVVGSALGGLCMGLSRQNRKVLGIDFSHSAVEMAKRRSKEFHDQEFSSHPHYVKSNILSPEIPLPSESFSLIVDNHCLHGLLWPEQRKKYWQQLKKWLHPSGYILLETICQDQKGQWPWPYFLDGRSNLWYAETPYRKVLPARELEAECLEQNLTIEYFVYCPHLRYQFAPDGNPLDFYATHPQVGMLRMVLSKRGH